MSPVCLRRCSGLSYRSITACAVRAPAVPRSSCAVATEGRTRLEHRNSPTPSLARQSDRHSDTRRTPKPLGETRWVTNRYARGLAPERQIQRHISWKCASPNSSNNSLDHAPNAASVLISHRRPRQLPRPLPHQLPRRASRRSYRSSCPLAHCRSADGLRNAQSRQPRPEMQLLTPNGARYR
jgi:hypothetical protein